MADETKSFSDLLSEAPLAPNEDTVSLVGTLARSNQPGKFVLATSPGNSLTLDVDAVKSHQVIGGGVGQLLVQVDVDRAKVPESVQGAATPLGLPVTGVHDLKGIQDVKHPTLDKYPWEEPVRTHPETDLGPFALAAPQQAPQSALTAMQGAASSALMTVYSDVLGTGYRDTYKHPILDKYPWEEPVRTNPETDLGAFALAAPQQAPQSSLEAVQGGAVSALKTVFSADLGGTGYRDVYKHPWLDATGRPPYLD